MECAKNSENSGMPEMRCISKHKQKENLKKCPCTYMDCPRKGICCKCLAYHLERDELPACCFSKEAEKTFDRSFERFAKDKGLV